MYKSNKGSCLQKASFTWTSILYLTVNTNIPPELRSYIIQKCILKNNVSFDYWMFVCLLYQVNSVPPLSIQNSDDHTINEAPRLFQSSVWTDLAWVRSVFHHSSTLTSTTLHCGGVKNFGSWLCTGAICFSPQIEVDHESIPSLKFRQHLSRTSRCV